MSGSDFGRPYIERLRKHVPIHLLDDDSWVLWRSTEQSGRIKPAKIPYNPANEEEAKTNDPSTAGPFNLAADVFLQAEGTSRSYSGLGYMLKKDAGIVAIDIDACRDPDTGLIYPWAMEIVLDMNSYTEFSPSGTGLHILVDGEIREPKQPRGIEVYDDGRYITMTGLWLPGITRWPESRQRRLTRLMRTFARDSFNHPFKQDGCEENVMLRGAPIRDDVVLQCLYHTKYGERIRNLGKGIREPGESLEEAGLAFLRFIAALNGGNVSQMDRLMRLSGLFHERWDQPQGERSYGETMIERAIDSLALHNPLQSSLQANPLTVMDYTDTANAELLSRMLNKQVRYVREGRQWRQYDGRVWRLVTDDVLIGLARDIFRQRAESLMQKGITRNEQAVQWAAESLSVERLQAAVQIMKTNKDLVMAMDEFDTHLEWINVSNGTIEFQLSSDGVSPVLRYYRSSDRITRLAPAVYNPKAKGSGFRSLVQMACGKNSQLVRYLQTMIGASLLGCAGPGTMFICEHAGDTIAADILALLQRSMGNYLARFDADALLLRDRRERDDSALATMATAPMLIAPVRDHEHRLDTYLLKSLSHRYGSRMTRVVDAPLAQSAHGNLWIVANELPVLPADDPHLWRRIQVIPFRDMEETDSADPTLHLPDPSVVDSDVLNWVLEGMVQWQNLCNQQQAIHIPAAVMSATVDYQRRMKSLDSMMRSRP